MATFKYFVSGKKSERASIYLRLSAGRKMDLISNTLLYVNPDRWSNKTENLKQRITTDADKELIKKLDELKIHVKGEFETQSRIGKCSKEWLNSVIYKFHTKKDIRAKSLNDYIDKFITEAKEGTRKKSKRAVNLAPGTIRVLEGFKRIFGEYQGIYTPERIEWHKDKEKHGGKEKPLRPLKKIDFENINIDFYNSFVNFLTDEGYAVNTIGRFIKSLKMIMKRSLQDKCHNNREFEYEAFAGLSETTFATYLTASEIEKIYNRDLSMFPRMDLARDAFIILCETCLRISDYSKIDINIRTIEKKRFIDIQQTKTGSRVIIPLTPRFEAIWKKYGKKLPKIPEQHVNKYIKVIAQWCGIDEEKHWEGIKFGKRYQKSEPKYKLITCHTGRRSACTNMYKAGIPLKDIRAISGHASDKQLLEYIKITPEETALRLSDNAYFSSNLKVVS